MGYDGYEIEGALYGFKTDLIEMLRNGDVPSWAQVPDSVGRGQPTKPSASEHLQQRKDEGRHSAEFHINTNQKNVTSTTTVNSYQTPERIAEKAQSWLDNNRDGLEINTRNKSILFKYFSLTVTFGERGGIKDARVNAWFKNH